jgi:hypothetical protein
MDKKKNSPNAYTRIIETLFLQHYTTGDTEVHFDRSELIVVAKQLGIDLPKNLGDIIYSFRYRAVLPVSIRDKAPKGAEWIIRPAGKAKYKFVVSYISSIIPSKTLAETKIPNSTPGVIESYALSDEQALLAKLRYNRLIDIFTGIACYSLQSHLRTHIAGLGQVETDELYIGIDKRGSHFVIPIQAKGGSDKLSIVQIEQDIAVCKTKFPNLICRPIAAQFISDNFIALFEFECNTDDVSVLSEKHYRLVPFDQLTTDDLTQYRNRGDL